MISNNVIHANNYISANTAAILNNNYNYMPLLLQGCYKMKGYFFHSDCSNSRFFSLHFGSTKKNPMDFFPTEIWTSKRPKKTSIFRFWRNIFYEHLCINSSHLEMYTKMTIPTNIPQIKSHPHLKHSIFQKAPHLIQRCDTPCNREAIARGSFITTDTRPLSFTRWNFSHKLLLHICVKPRDSGVVGCLECLESEGWGFGGFISKPPRNCSKGKPMGFFEALIRREF